MIFIWRVFAFILWVIFELFLLILTLLFIAWTFAQQFWGFEMIGEAGVEIPIPSGPIFLMLYVGIPLFFFWFLFPTLIPFLRDIFVPFLNLLLMLFCFLWDLFILLYNLLAQIQNALVPLWGIIIYMVEDLVTTVLDQVMKILGSGAVHKLFKAVMQILQFLTKLVIEIMQALITVAISLMKILIKIIGVIIKIVMGAVQLLLPIVKWVIGLLFALLEPILKFVVDLVGWFLSAFALVAYASRSLQSLGDRVGMDSFQFNMYADVTSTTHKYWTPEKLHVAQKELSIMNEHILHNPIQSFDYYFTIIHPGYASQTLYSDYPKAYLGERYTESNHNYGGRSLLEEGYSRKLLSEEEYNDLTTPPAQWDDEMWKVFDTQGPYIAHKMFEEKQITQGHRKNELAERVQRKLLGMLKNNTDDKENPILSDIEWYAERHRRIEEAQKKPHRFADKMDKKIKCTSYICGGEGTALDFPIHSLRKHMEKHMNSPVPSWKDDDQTEEEFADEMFIHGSSWLAGVREASDRFFNVHMRNPALHKATQHAFEGLTGHKEFQTAYEAYHKNYGDTYHLLHTFIPTIHDLPFFKWLIDMDENKDDYYGNWIKTVKIKERVSSETQRKVLEVELDPINNIEHRKLMSLAEYDWDYEVVDTGDQSVYNLYYYPVKISDINNQSVVNPNYYSSRKPLANIGGFIINSNGAQFPSNPPINIANHTADKNAAAARPSSTAHLPLFQLLTQATCNTSPKNFLCWPFIPKSLTINTCPTLVWPAAAQGDDFCNYLFCPSPRNLLDPAAYISWCRITNGVREILFFLALVPFLSTTMGILAERFPWIGWIWEWLLIFPPGHTPAGVDWVCWVMHLYDLWLDVFLTWLAWLLLLPLVEFAVVFYLSLIGLYETYSVIDTARAERIAETSMLFSQMSYDSSLNPGKMFYNDPNYYRYERGMDRVQKRPDWAGYEGMRGHSTLGPSQGTSSWLPKSGQTPYERMAGATPYKMTSDGESYTLPYANTLNDLNAPSDIPQQSLIGAPLDNLHQIQQEKEVRKTETQIKDQLKETEKLLEKLEFTLQRASLIFGVPHLSVTYGELHQFERSHRWWLHSFQFSFWWMIQRFNYIRRESRNRHRYTPVNGPYREGFTSWWNPPEGRRKKQEPVIPPIIGEENV